jgi:hypothetical protein
MELAGGIGMLPTVHGMEPHPKAAMGQAIWDDHSKLVHASIRLGKAGGYRLELQGYELGPNPSESPLK